MTWTSDETPGSLRFDLGPEGLRIESAAPQTGETVFWCRDAVTVMRSRKGEERGYARVDLRKLDDERAAIDPALTREFGVKQPATRAAGPMIYMNWAFDDAMANGEFSFGAMYSDRTVTPFGWLLTLRHKGVAPIAADKALRFETDGGRAQIEVSAIDGLLRRFIGSGRDATTTIEIQDAAFVAELPPGWFDFPERAADDRDMTAYYAGQLIHTAHAESRLQTWRTILAALEKAHDVPTTTSAMKVLCTLQETSLSHGTAREREHFKHAIEQVRNWVKQQVAAGQSELEKPLAAFRADFEKGLDRFSARWIAAIETPQEIARTPLSEKLLEAERDVADDVLEVQFRVPLLKAFDEATAHGG